MYRLRRALGAVAAVALATSGVGCNVFWDNAHEFPLPGRYSELPGSYTGPPLGAGGRGGDASGYAPPASATGTRESGSTVAPFAPQSDDVGGVAPPPSVPTSPSPYAPPAY